jgi:putative ATP-dependent endonuclease of OLD family
LENAGKGFFEDEQNRKRRTVLQHAPTADILTAKRHLLSMLRTYGICLLEKGDIESYYPDGVTGPDKPSKALDFCRRTDTREKALTLCDKIPVAEGTEKAEFELIFERIFGRE